LTNGNFKINKLLIAWGALALKLRVALQIIIILNKLGGFLPVKMRTSASFSRIFL
jgi:hypothetical protein